MQKSFLFFVEKNSPYCPSYCASPPAWMRNAFHRLFKALFQRKKRGEVRAKPSHGGGYFRVACRIADGFFCGSPRKGYGGGIHDSKMTGYTTDCSEEGSIKNLSDTPDNWQEVADGRTVWARSNDPRGTGSCFCAIRRLLYYCRGRISNLHNG